jgi:hypothetical protein
MLIGAGRHNDCVLSTRINDNARSPRRTLDGPYVPGIDAKTPQRGQKLLTEDVVTSDTKQDRWMTKPRNSDGLIGPLAARVQLKTGSDDRFAGLRNALRL